ncbi:MAG TPA: hypothetical protein VFJ52_04490, partial [Terriglobia bacterium]|nr:hypothetical protein [Terriglobia bacterium]
LAAAIEDTNPFIGQGAHRSVMGSAALPLPVVISPSPERSVGGGGREFVERPSWLAQTLVL